MLPNTVFLLTILFLYESINEFFLPFSFVFALAYRGNKYTKIKDLIDVV